MSRQGHVSLPGYLDPVDRASGWRYRAACRGRDTEVFFELGKSERRIRTARVVCEQCPVRAECLRENLTVPYGMFGGLTEAERRRLSRQVERARQKRQRQEKEAV